MHIEIRDVTRGNSAAKFKNGFDLDFSSIVKAMMVKLMN